MLRLLKRLSPAGLINAQKRIAPVWFDMLTKGKSVEEIVEARDKILALNHAPQLWRRSSSTCSNEKLLEKRVSPFQAIKGGRRQKRIRPNLKGAFNL